jgi:hypothetical protein
MPFNVFLSWSQPRARRLAEALHRFLPDVIQIATPWISSEDIDKGRRWGHEVARALADTKIGIICLTAENLTAPWILFEAGALAKTLESTYVCPYLLDLEPRDVRPPLGDFQVTRAEKEDTLKLVRSLNRALGDYLDADRLTRAFERCWPELANVIEELRKEGAPAGEKAEKRNNEDVLGEILQRVRNLERQREPSQPRRKTLDPTMLPGTHGLAATVIAAGNRKRLRDERALLESLIATKKAEIASVRSTEAGARLEAELHRAEERLAALLAGAPIGDDEAPSSFGIVAN